MLIKNGYIIDPASGRAEFADLQISDGKIFSIGQHLSVSPSEEIIDASGLTIAPGLIDTHVHFRDPGFTYKEDIHTRCFCLRCRRIHFRDLYGKYQSCR